MIPWLRRLIPLALGVGAMVVFYCNQRRKKGMSNSSEGSVEGNLTTPTRHREPLVFKTIRRVGTREVGRENLETILIFAGGSVERTGDYSVTVHLPPTGASPLILKVFDEHFHPHPDLTLPADLTTISLIGNKNHLPEGLPNPGNQSGHFDGLIFHLANYDRAHLDSGGFFVVTFTHPLNISGPLKSGFIYRVEIPSGVPPHLVR